MYIAKDIGSPENIHYQSMLTHGQLILAARRLEASTAALEGRLAGSYGIGRRSWELSRVLGSACTFAALAVVSGLLQVGGVL